LAAVGQHQLEVQPAKEKQAESGVAQQRISPGGVALVNQLKIVKAAALQAALAIANAHSRNVAGSFLHDLHIVLSVAALLRKLGGPNQLPGRFDHALGHGLSFAFIAGQQRRSGPVVHHPMQLPNQVEGVGQPGIQPLAAIHRVHVTGVPGQEHPIAHGIVGGNRLLNGKLGKPDHLLKADRVGVDGLLDLVHRLLKGEVVAVEANVETVKVAFARNPGHVRGLVLKDNNLGNLRKIRFQHAIDNGPDDLRANDRERNLEVFSNPRPRPVGSYQISRSDGFSVRGDHLTARLKHLQALDFRAPFNRASQLAQLAVQQPLDERLTQHQKVLVQAPL